MVVPGGKLQERDTIERQRHAPPVDFRTAAFISWATDAVALCDLFGSLGGPRPSGCRNRHYVRRRQPCGSAHSVTSHVQTTTLFCLSPQLRLLSRLATIISILVTKTIMLLACLNSRRFLLPIGQLRLSDPSDDLFPPLLMVYFLPFSLFTRNTARALLVPRAVMSS